MTSKTTMAILVAGAVVAPAFLFAQSGGNCAQRQYVIDRLSSKHGESRQAIGLGTNNQVVEVFASLETGTWTITVTTPEGVTCLVASGVSFEALGEIVKGVPG